MAIWNMNRIAVAIAMLAWSTNVAFLILSKSTFVQRIVKLICPGFLYRYDPCEYMPPDFGLHNFPTHCLQLLAAWVPEQGVCQVLNVQTSEKSVIVLLISDVVLLLMMLVGLLRLRIHGNMFGFRKLLWNQVGNTAPSPDRLYVSRARV